MLTKLSGEALLDRSSRDVIELNVCKTRRCHAFGTWIGRIVKTYDYINRVDKRFRLAIFKGMKIHSSSRCYAITMILRVRRKILKLLRSPTPKTLVTNIKGPITKWVPKTKH